MLAVRHCFSTTTWTSAHKTLQNVGRIRIRESVMDTTRTVYSPLFARARGGRERGGGRGERERGGGRGERERERERKRDNENVDARFYLLKKREKKSMAFLSRKLWIRDSFRVSRCPRHALIAALGRSRQNGRGRKLSGGERERERERERDETRRDDARVMKR